MKPLIIYVSGAPGSGKTSLAKLLSEQLNVPHLSSDLIHGGIEFTHSHHNRTTVVQNILIPLMRDYAQKNISFVVDHVLYNDMAKTTIIDRLQEVAYVINIHTITADPIKRYVERISESELPDIIKRKEVLLGRVEHHRSNLSKSAELIDLGIPALAVTTNNGYSPTVDDIISFINQQRDI